MINQHIQEIINYTLKIIMLLSVTDKQEATLSTSYMIASANSAAATIKTTSL